MIVHLTKRAVAIIEEAYEEGLSVQFYQYGDWLRYLIEPSTLKILHKEAYEYKTVAVYNIEELLSSAHGNLIVHTQEGITFEFKHRGEDRL